MDRELRLPVSTLDTQGGRHDGGLLAVWRRRRALRAARRAADAEIVATARRIPRLAWREAELTDERSRRALARSVDKLIRSADARYLPGATPLNRLAVREDGAALQRLSDRLLDLDRPVTGHGVLLLQGLLTDGYGPLYVPYRAGELRWTLQYVAGRLEPAP